MKRLINASLALGLVGLGYLVGTSGVLSPQGLHAQPQPGAAPQGPSQEAANAIQTAHQSLAAASAALGQDGLYRPATTNLNAFLVLSGGGDAIRDLETGGGVDPETFAALYAGLATEEVAPHLTRDEQGRLLYKDKVVRMYPISRLQLMYAERARLAGQAE
ncbi:MAG: hypothetical protein ACREJB_11085 [Planctomycetaceae bacterium]